MAQRLRAAEEALARLERAGEMVPSVDWDSIEKNAPTGGHHTYDWSCADAIVGDYQGAGMRVQAYLSTQSSWGSVSGASLGGKDYTPTPEHMADYTAWVSALIERYDGDGDRDMPGLISPIRFWVVGGEWTGFWPSGDASEYITVLQATRDAARAAYADLRLGAIPFMLVDVFDGDPPTDAHVVQRLTDPPPVMRDSTAGMRAILARADLYDYIDVHSLGDYTEIPPLLAWMRGAMPEPKPIWIDDAFPTTFLANAGWPDVWPVTPDRHAAAKALVDAIGKRQQPAYSDAIRWLRAEAAKGTVQKVATAIGEGAVGINIGNTEDWCDYTTVFPNCGTWEPFGGVEYVEGMIDDTAAGDTFGACSTRTAGAPRPALRDFALVADRIGDGTFDAVARIPLAGTGARGYSFARGGSRFWIVWHEDRVLQLPGDPVETAASVNLPVPPTVARVTVTETITDAAATSPRVTTIDVANGVVALLLTSVPVIVEASP